MVSDFPLLRVIINNGIYRRLSEFAIYTCLHVCNIVHAATTEFSCSHTVLKCRLQMYKLTRLDDGVYLPCEDYTQYSGLCIHRLEIRRY